MRLDPALIPDLLADACEVFGGDAELWLFGSRVDDKARGGDIDLYVETANETGLLERRLEFQRRLFRLFGDRKVDVVIHPRTHPLSPIHRIARKTGILLNEVRAS